MNTQLKQLPKEPLENKKEFKDFQECTYQFLLGIFEAGKMVGFKQGYEVGKEDEQGVSKRIPLCR